MGDLLRARLEAIDSPAIAAVRGRGLSPSRLQARLRRPSLPPHPCPTRLACRRGLLNAVVVRPDGANDAGALCHALMGAGLLAKPTHGDIIRLAPPLVISEEQVMQAADIIEREARNSRRVGGGGAGGQGFPTPHPTLHRRRCTACSMNGRRRRPREDARHPQSSLAPAEGRGGNLNLN